MGIKKNRRSQEEEERQYNRNRAKAGLMGLGIGMGGGAVAQGLLGSAFMAHDPHATNKYRDKIKANSGRPDIDVVDLDKHFPNLDAGTRKGFYANKNTAKMLKGHAKDPDRIRGEFVGLGGDSHDYIAAHEFGHAKKPGLILGANRKGYVPSKLLTMSGAGTAAGIGMATSKNEKVRKWSPLAPLIAGAPMMIEEARASVNADRNLRDIMTKPELAHSRKKLLQAFGTYAALPVAGAIGTYATRKYMDKKLKRQEEEEEGREKRAYIDRFEGAGLMTGPEQSRWDFMNSFYDYDQGTLEETQDSWPKKGLGRPNGPLKTASLNEFEKQALFGSVKNMAKKIGDKKISFGSSSRMNRALKGKDPSVGSIGGAAKRLASAPGKGLGMGKATMDFAKRQANRFSSSGRMSNAIGKQKEDLSPTLAEKFRDRQRGAGRSQSWHQKQHRKRFNLSKDEQSELAKNFGKKAQLLKNMAGMKSIPKARYNKEVTRNISKTVKVNESIPLSRR